MPSTKPGKSGIRWTLSLAVMALTVAAAAQATRGQGEPDGCRSCALDGTCLTNSKEFGYYPTKWRRWPGALMPDVGPPKTRPLGVPPVEVPPRTKEDAESAPRPPKTDDGGKETPKKDKTEPDKGKELPKNPLPRDTEPKGPNIKDPLDKGGGVRDPLKDLPSGRDPKQPSGGKGPTANAAPSFGQTRTVAAWLPDPAPMPAGAARVETKTAVKPPRTVKPSAASAAVYQASPKEAPREATRIPVQTRGPSKPAVRAEYLTDTTPAPAAKSTSPATRRLPPTSSESPNPLRSPDWWTEGMKRRGNPLREESAPPASSDRLYRLEGFEPVR